MEATSGWCGGRERQFECDTFFILEFAALTCQAEIRTMMVSGCSHTKKKSGGDRQLFSTSSGVC